MLHQATIYVDPTDATAIGFTTAAGMPGDFKFDFKLQNNTPPPDILQYYAQMVLRPFTSHSRYAYDIVINDPTGGSGIATVPGAVLNDRFHVEVYTRYPNGQPYRMLAYGRIDLTGWGYQSSGPLGPASYPQGPQGPAGLQGPSGAPGPEGLPGVRGSRWYTGAGVPTGTPIPDDRIDGDMWLNETNGDVWRWNALSSSWMTFRGE